MEVRAFLWHQGESDGTIYEVAKDYYNNLKWFLSYVRGVIGNVNLPFIAGTISAESEQGGCTYYNIINDAINRLGQEDPNFHVIDLSGAPLKSDHLHFGAVAAEYYGQKVFDCLIDIGVITGTKINPIKPW